MTPTFNLSITFEKRSEDHYVLRGQIADERYAMSYRSVPTFAQVGTFTGSCAVKYLSRDWSTQGGNF